MSDLWWRITKMKKEAKSPAAIAHKRKYETQYESTPARKKYRRELERERRKRGVAGKGGKDMSHTKEGKIVPEEPHTNRARSHPSVGSTLKMVRIAKTVPMCIRCGGRTKLTRIEDEGGYHICTPCYIQMMMQEGQKMSQQRQAQQAQDTRYDTMMYHGEPMDVVARLLKAPLHDVNTGEQVAGAPQPMTDFQAIDPNRNRFLPDPFEEDFKFLTDHIKAPNQYQYESPDKSTRGVVNVENDQATILGFTTHRDKRGEGRGTRALRNLTEELREVHPNLREINTMGGGGQDAFWEKMKREGVIKAPFPAKYGGNCVECGQYIQEGQPAHFVNNPQRKGLKCPYNCGRAYVV